MSKPSGLIPILLTATAGATLYFLGKNLSQAISRNIDARHKDATVSGNTEHQWKKGSLLGVKNKEPLRETIEKKSTKRKWTWADPFSDVSDVLVV